MIKALDVTLKYKESGEEDKFTIYTSRLEISLTEVVHQSILPSSAIGLSIFMGKEYLGKYQEDWVEGEVDKIRETIRERVTNYINQKSPKDRRLLAMLEEGFNTALEWFES